jgi:hypothetical protein
MVQRDSGFTYGHSKYSTINMQLGGAYDGIVTNLNPTPFPALDAIFTMRLPFYDMADVMTADDQAFSSTLIAVSSGYNSVKNAAIWLGIFCVLTAIGGGYGIFLISTGADKKKSRNELLADHTDGKDD